MDWNRYFDLTNEKPLDKLVEGYSRTSVFRKIAFVGDSLSSGEFETRDAEGKPHYHDLYEYSWGQYLARKNGLCAYNFSRGGMTAKEYLESFAEARGFWDRDKAAQAYVIALGVNDVLNRGTEIGCIEDIDLGDPKKSKPTFIGNYAQIVLRYKAIVPDAKFFFVTIPRGTNAERNAKAAEMVPELYRLAELVKSAYVIDLHRYAPIYDEAFKRRFFLHGHMNPDGYIFTAELVDSYIDYIVRHNPDDFKNVGFVTTNIPY